MTSKNRPQFCLFIRGQNPGHVPKLLHVLLAFAPCSWQSAVLNWSSFNGAFASPRSGNRETFRDCFGTRCSCRDRKCGASLRPDKAHHKIEITEYIYSNAPWLLWSKPALFLLVLGVFFTTQYCWTHQTPIVWEEASPFYIKKDHIFKNYWLTQSIYQKCFVHVEPNSFTLNDWPKHTNDLSICTPEPHLWTLKPSFTKCQ